MNEVDFTRRLIKGKIAEIIFEQIVNHMNGYTILEFGYEKVVRQLANEMKTDKSKETIRIVRRAPDFAIINEKTHDVTLVEVKYMKEASTSSVLKAAKEIRKSWKKASLFVVSPTGFYFNEIETIIANKGKISPFNHKLISKTKQKAYLELVNEFVRV